jgi:hypothetical protein
VQARLAALFLGGFHGRYFAADRIFIAGVTRAEHLGQVRSEIRDYFLDAQNRGWVRHGLRIRVSARRLTNIAIDYLPSAPLGTVTIPAGDSRNPFGPPA